MMDDELGTADSSGEFSERTLLLELLQSDLVRSFRFRDDGPPQGVDPISQEGGLVGAPAAYPGWAIVETKPSDGVWSVTLGEHDGSAAWAGVIGDAMEVAAQDSGSGAYREQGEVEASRLRRADALAVQVASQAVEADLYVTDRLYPSMATWDLGRDVLVCPPTDAVALLGLFLRAQGEYKILHNFGYNRGLYFWVGAREILYEAWRWYSACVKADKFPDCYGLQGIGESLIRRVQRALESRDRVHIALNQPQHNDTRREMLSELDDVLVNLMGAVDASARVAHEVLRLSGSERRAAWQNRAWRDAVGVQAPDLAEVVAPDTTGYRALSVLRILRNTVHGAALHALALHRSGQAEESYVKIPPDEEKEVLSSIDALGGRALWGVVDLASPGTYFDPHRFLEALIPNVVSTLNALMAATPVEQLRGVSLTAADCQPPADATPSNSSFSPLARSSIRWQLGL